MTPQEQIEAALKALEGITPDALVNAYAEDHDSDGYAFNGDDYDLALIRDVCEWLTSGNSERLKQLFAARAHLSALSAPDLEAVKDGCGIDSLSLQDQLPVVMNWLKWSKSAETIKENDPWYYTWLSKHLPSLGVIGQAVGDAKTLHDLANTLKDKRESFADSDAGLNAYCIVEEIIERLSKIAVSGAPDLKAVRAALELTPSYFADWIKESQKRYDCPSITKIIEDDLKSVQTALEQLKRMGV